jgi:hypothetical protein
VRVEEKVDYGREGMRDAEADEETEDVPQMHIERRMTRSIFRWEEGFLFKLTTKKRIFAVINSKYYA